MTEEAHQKDPEHLRLLAVEVGLRAMAKLRSIYPCAFFSQSLQGDSIRADVEVENYVLEVLKGKGFRGTVVTEEAGVVELGDDNVVAVVDPLDGSSNFAARIPWFSVSVAFAVGERDLALLDDVVAGAVVPFYEGRPISFARGRGVFLGGSRVTPKVKGGKTLLVVFYGEDPEAIRAYERVNLELTNAGWYVKARSLGSVALELAYVALGMIDLFVDARAKLRNVDVAAALGILREAGGSFSDASGRPLTVPLDEVRPVRSLVASASAELLSRVVKAMGVGA